jgi:hypothetical protein
MLNLPLRREIKNGGLTMKDFFLLLGKITLDKKWAEKCLELKIQEHGKD